ncbi:MAG: hypothetical protein IT370_28580 [Deltaproteobacteria bacterium]|nr:hypothetical protein [Deltaproteobacteria bacterium]
MLALLGTLILGAWSTASARTPKLSREAVVRNQLATQRKIQIARLRAYAEARHFPRNTYRWGKVNVLIDEDGTICAAANLMAKAGQMSLVRKTAKQNNFLRFADVRSGALMTWMLKSGLTQEEIAVIQEPYVLDQGEPGFDEREDERLYTHFMTTIEQLEKNTAASLDIAVARLLAA